MAPLRTAVLRASQSFDYYVRSVTTAILALAIVAAVIYERVTGHRSDPVLLGWAGLIIGIYFGYHVTANGAGVRGQVAQNAVAETLHAVEVLAPREPSPPPPPPPPAQ